MFSQEIFNIDLFLFLRGLTLYSKSVRISFFFLRLSGEGEEYSKERKSRLPRVVSEPLQAIFPCAHVFNSCCPAIPGGGGGTSLILRN